MIFPSTPKKNGSQLLPPIVTSYTCLLNIFFLCVTVIGSHGDAQQPGQDRQGSVYLNLGINVAILIQFGVFQ